MPWIREEDLKVVVTRGARWTWGKHRSIALVIGLLLVAGGGTAIGWAAASQHHAPSPQPLAFGTTGRFHPGGGRSLVSPTTIAGFGSAPTGPVLPASAPTAIAIPVIGVFSPLQQLGLNPDGTIQVPQPGPLYNEAGWYHYSPTPGQLGPSIILGHVDSAANGPSVFYRLGDLHPGDKIDIGRTDGTVAVFSVSGVRDYPKATFPTNVIYGNTNFAALRLVTCGGAFDSGTGHYVDNVVVFASLSSVRPPH